MAILLSRIKALCRSKGISVTTLETETHIAVNTIYRWGKSSPSVDKVKAVADYFGVTVDDLLREDAGE